MHYKELNESLKNVYIPKNKSLNSYWQIFWTIVNFIIGILNYKPHYDGNAHVAQ